ncbi:MAG: choice-of-anchor J domain-containing protein [Deltaproteobacteria bacterium]|nr:choice-of-anchor J domain-containing protein [Deltaproteobacteria bacterium]
MHRRRYRILTVLLGALALSGAACSTGRSRPSPDGTSATDGGPPADGTLDDGGTSDGADDAASGDDGGGRRDGGASDGRPATDGAVADAKPRTDGPRTDRGLPGDARPRDSRVPDARVPDARRPDARLPADSGAGGPLVAPFTLDFEAGGGGLTATRDWQWGVLRFAKGTGCSASATPPPAPHSGTHCWGTVLNDCHNPIANAANTCSNTDPNDDSVLALKVAIPSSFTTATLAYWEWYDVFLPYDWTELRIDGKVVTQRCTGDYVTPTAWVRRTVDLAAYRGKTITIAFHFMATASVNYAGWYLDDVSVTGP